MLDLTKVVVMSAAVALIFGVGASSARTTESRTPLPGTYTYERALALGILKPKDFTPPAGMKTCPPYDATVAAIPPGAPPPPQRAPVCFINPADLARSVVAVPAPGSPPFGGTSTYQPSCSTSGFPNHRFNGSCDAAIEYRGTSMLTEVSNPSVCLTGGCPVQHFYSRVALTTPANNYIEVGWTESNHAPITGDVQRVMTVTGQGAQQTPMLHGTVLPGSQYAFREDHCGFPGELLVCMEMWNGSSWTVLRSWSGVMRCLNANGTFNCAVDILSEAFSSDTGSWFNLNGGPDGLKTQNIEVKRDWWDLFTTGGWLEQAPYTICRVAAYYHFTVFRGPPSC